MAISPIEQSDAERISEEIHKLVDAVETVVIGKRPVVEMAMLALLCRGHLLIEDIPGVGKTTLAKALARVIGGEFRRIQFTPDLLPSDVTGSTIYNQKTGEFQFHAGPVFANVVLADEINRTTPKTQSALLEAMEERTVSVDGETHQLPAPFFVIATENNVELLGTYPLPEAQMDRFFAKVALGYPDSRAEAEILSSHQFEDPIDRLEPITDPDSFHQLQEETRRVWVEDSVRDYIVTIVAATRSHPRVALGSSPRGSLALMAASQSWAVFHRRPYVVPDDVKRMAEPVMTHRIIGRPDSQGRTPSAGQIVQEILDSTPTPVYSRS
ncbi:MAG: MoxR family ATPase [Armatimonadetes bacterium]|nr:MoxR family ATPase [Armatimonadota bacterium]